MALPLLSGEDLAPDVTFQTSQGNRILNSPDNQGMEDKTNRTNGTYRTDRIFCQMNPIGLTSLTGSGLTNPIGPIGPIGPGPNSPTGHTCPINHPLPVR